MIGAERIVCKQSFDLVLNISTRLSCYTVPCHAMPLIKFLDGDASLLLAHPLK